MNVVILLLLCLSLHLYLGEAILRPFVPPSLSLYRGYPSAKTDASKLHAMLSEEKSECDSLMVVANAAKPASASMLQTLGPVLASAFCVAALMYPLDLVRALQMANSGSGTKLSTMELLSNFRDTHGVQGFFTQGLAPELARSTWMRLLKFGLFPIIHEKLTGLPEKLGSSQSKALAAILASVPEAVTIMPLEIAKISLQLDTTKRFGNSMVNAMKSVFAEKSFAGFTAGYVGVQARQALWTAGYFASISFFEEKVNRAIKAVKGEDFDIKKDRSMQVFSQLSSGFLAGVFGAALNTPFDTIRTTVQKRLLSTVPQVGSTTLLGVGSEIVTARGFSGLYSGFQFKAFHLGGGGALMAFFVPLFGKVFANLK